MAASYTTEREQFGRPIGSFQAVQQRMADAFIDVEAIRWTMWQAAWLLEQGGPPGREAGIAKFWAAEAGSRVAATAQQVHGGIGIDTTYPLFRYFLWAKHNELTLGSASAQLARIGASYVGGDSVTSIDYRTTTLDWRDINVGDEVTPLEIPVTATVIVAGAIASRDFMPVHHDREFAKKQGSPNIFMNILTTNGLCVRFLTDWAGPEAMVKRLAIRLGVPAFPNDRCDSPAPSPARPRAPTVRGSSRSSSRAATVSATTCRAPRPSACSRTGSHELCAGRPPIAGIGQTEFSKESGRSELQLACEAVKAALDDAGLQAERRRRHGHLHDGLERRDRGRAKPRHRRPDVLQPRALRRRGRGGHGGAGRDGRRDRHGRRRGLLPRVQRAVRVPLRRLDCAAHR